MGLYLLPMLTCAGGSTEEKDVPRYVKLFLFFVVVVFFCGFFFDLGE